MWHTLSLTVFYGISIMVSRLSNRIAIVPGESSGLGRVISLAYAREGAAVICADVQPSCRFDTRNEFPVPIYELIIDHGGKASFVRTDSREEAQIEALAAFAVKEYGRLDM